MYFDSIRLTIFICIHSSRESIIHIILRHPCFFYAISAIWQPACFGMTIGICGDDNTFTNACVSSRRRRGQAGNRKLCASERATRQLICFDDTDFALFLLIVEGYTCCLAYGYRYILRAGSCKAISFRRADFTNSVASGLHIAEGCRSVSAGSNRLQNRTSAQQFKYRPRKSCTGVRILLCNGNRAMRHFKRNGCGGKRVRFALLRNDDLLDAFIRYTHKEIGFFIRGSHGLDRHGEAGSSSRNRDRISAVQVVIRAILTAAISGHAANRTAHAHLARIRSHSDSTYTHAIGVGNRFIGHIDGTGTFSICNGIGRKPACIFQIFSRSTICTAVEIVQIPIGANIFLAFQFTDHLANRKLTGCTAPVFVFGIVAIDHHERVRVTNDPRNSMHGAV